MGQNPEELTTTGTAGTTDTRMTGRDEGVDPVPGASTSPADIEATRASLSRDIDELTEKVSPARVVDRRKEAAKQAARGRWAALREKVMGAVPDRDAVTGDVPGLHTGPGTGPGAGERVSELASSVSGSVSQGASGAVGTLGARAQGNPLAAGLVAFGAGMLLSAVLPASEQETRVASRAVEAAKEHGQPLVEEARSVGQQMGADLKDSAVESAEQVKDTAAESADRVAAEGRSSAETVKDDATPTS
jgi:hypothetical protein